MPRTCPVLGSTRMDMGISVSVSNVTDPSGTESVTLVSLPAQPDPTGTTKAKDELPSPSATSGGSKLKEKRSLPVSLRPVIRCSPSALGSKGGASTTKDGLRKGSPSVSIPPQSRRDSAS